ncbi:MAG TPA: shikimate kinase [Candidatus Eisenbergiella intestinipullorum]|nr:shikimate kinase [Candidatus Eisenbergiella intestinipullorum]
MSGKPNIVLIGMPGAGKSTVGVVLAKRMGRRFLDSDLVIQEKTGRLLHEIISEEGLEGFLAIENEVNAGLPSDGSVIATGGSVIYGAQAMEHLKRTGHVVYLKLSFSEIESRLGDLKKRGVALREGQTLRELYEERIPLYEKYADLTLECGKKSIRDIVEELAVRLEQVRMR